MIQREAGLVLAMSAMVGCATFGTARLPVSWKTFDNDGRFAVRVPSDFQREYLQGIDSYVVAFRNDRMRIVCDYGAYSGGTPSDVRSEETVVGGRDARITVWEMRNTKHPWIALLSVQRVRPNVGLSMYANCRGRRDLSTAKRILRSVVFLPDSARKP